MSNVSLNLYRIFCVVAQSKSYAEASEKLNITISTISTSIKKLENLLDIKLFDRNNDGVSLTRVGEELFKLIVNEVETIDYAEKAIVDKTQLPNGEITIGCQSHVASYYLMDYIEKAQEKYPNLKIDLIGNMSSDEMINFLQMHKVDLLVMHIKPKKIDEKIWVKKLKSIRNIFVSNKPVQINNIKELNKYKFILSSDYTRTNIELNQVLKKHDIKLNCNIKSDITEVRIEAAKRGLGLAYVMEDSVKRELKKGELYKVKVPMELPSLDINLGYIKGQLTKVSQEFIKKYLENN